MKTKILLIKLGLYFAFFISIYIGYIKPVKADLKVVTTSIWDFWEFISIKNVYHNQYFLTGNTKALLLTNEDYNKIKLHFGVNSNRDGNFNYINTKEILLYGNIYLDADIKDNGVFTVGFKGGELGRVNIINSRGYDIGMPILPLYASYKNDPQRIVLDGSYMQTNEAFSLGYNHKIGLGYGNIGLYYIPNLDCNLSNIRSLYRDLQKNLGSLDGYFSYYNEYKDIGYGLLSGGRIYVKNALTPEGAEFYISPNLDYLGFGLSFSLLGGTINAINSNFSYQLSELILYYSILKLNISATYGYNTVYGGYKYGNYSYSNLNFSMNYFLNSRFSLKGAIYSNKATSYVSNNGIAIGFNIKV